MSALRLDSSNRTAFEAQMNRWIDLGMGTEHEFVALMPFVLRETRFLLIPRYSYVKQFARLVQSIDVGGMKAVESFDHAALHDTVKISCAYVVLDLNDGSVNVDRSARRICRDFKATRRLAFSLFEGLAHLLLAPVAVPASSVWLLGGSYYSSQDYKTAVLSEPGRDLIFTEIDGVVAHRDTSAPSCGSRLFA